MPVLRLMLAAATAVLVSVPAAFADGPFEPNETASTATGPLTQTVLDAGLETPQDEDWYLLHPGAPRQIGILGKLVGTCPQSYGRLAVDLHDADGIFATSPMGSFRLGYNPSAPSTSGPVTAQQLAFTSIAGHRYLVHVTQSGCDGVGYQLSIGPGDALGTKLVDTKECADAKRVARKARAKSTRLRRAYRRARGLRRTTLRSRYVIQKQSIPVAQSEATSRCTRRVLAGYPWD